MEKNIWKPLPAGVTPKSRPPQFPKPDGPSTKYCHRQTPVMHSPRQFLSPTITPFHAQHELYSRKVFVGGLPIDISERELHDTFGKFGRLFVDWPRGKFVSGCVFLVFDSEFSVRKLVWQCYSEKNRFYMHLNSKTMRDKPVQVRPWLLADTDYKPKKTQFLDPRQTIFIGGLPRPTRAADLANKLERAFGPIAYVGIDIDPELQYPKGTARLTFSNAKSFIAAINCRSVRIQLDGINKRVDMEPYKKEVVEESSKMTPTTSYAPAQTMVMQQPNKLVYIGDKAYEVFFLDDEAVIEKDGVPRRIYFEDGSRKLIIDGVPHEVPLGVTTKVKIDGHNHKIRFGAPSRELYLGKSHFAAQFGGPAIQVRINSVPHSFQLMGPSPEVKIGDPGYDLLPAYTLHLKMQTPPPTPMPLARPPMPKSFPPHRSMIQTTYLRHHTPKMYMQPPPSMQSRQHQQSQLHSIASTSKVIKKDFDVSAFLKKMKSTGILDKLRANSAGTGNASSNSAIPTQPQEQQPNTAHFCLINFERQASPTSPLEHFNTRTLMIRYDSVIEALHQQQLQGCPQCGIRLDELYGVAHQKHRDWHIKEIQAMSENKYWRSTPWFMTEDWFGYSETELVNGRTPKDATKGNPKIPPQMDPNSSDVKDKKCCLCYEPFTEYWEDDDEEWKLKECVPAGKKGPDDGWAHPKCLD